MLQKLISTNVLRESYATFVMNHGNILLGLTYSYPALLIPQLKSEGFDSNVFIESMLGSISILMLGISTIIISFIVGKTSRKRITQLALIVYATGTTILLVSTNIVTICIGLLIQSSVVSIYGVITLSYVSEVCQKEHRSTLLTVMFLASTVGYSLCHILNSLISWRMTAVIMLLIAASEFLQLFVIPESNYWYLLEGREEEAKSSILWYEPSLSTDALNRRVRSIVEANDFYNANQQKGGQLAMIFRSLKQWRVLKPLLVGTLLVLIKCGDGRLVIGAYAVAIVRNINTPYDVSSAIRWFGWVNITGSLIVLSFVHKVQRKTLIVSSTAVLVASSGSIIMYTFFRDANVIPHWLPIVGLYIYTMCLITSFHSAIIIVISEIQAPTLRPQMTLLIGGIGMVFGWFYSLFFPYVERILPIQYIFLWFIASVCLTTLVVVYLLPETSKLEFFENEERPKDNANRTNSQKDMGELPSMELASETRNGTGSFSPPISSQNQ